MYKSGKAWVVAGITAISLLGGGRQTTHADEVSVVTHMTDVPTSASKNSMIARSSVTANTTYTGTQDNTNINRDD